MLQRIIEYQSIIKVIDFGTAIWLVIATYFELPVSPQQATQAALFGSMLVTEGFDYIPLWNKVLTKAIGKRKEICLMKI